MPSGKILLVEDDKIVRETIRRILEMENYQILEAENGEEAVKIIHQGDNMLNVALILCDIQMPKMNGVKFIEYLNQHAPGIQVAVMTGYSDTELAVSLMKFGVKEYLIKPVENEKLIQTVTRLINLGKGID